MHRWWCAALVFVLSSGAAAAATIVPGTDSFVWENGDSKGFSLEWTGSAAVFAVEDLGVANYASLEECCTTLFDRVREVHPGATLTFSDLQINTYPISTVFVDDLDFTLFKAGALDNLGVLTGLVTLEWDDPYARMATLGFFAEGDVNPPDPSPVPEPGTLMLLGGGLLAAAAAARRRRRERVTLRRVAD